MTRDTKGWIISITLSILAAGFVLAIVKIISDHMIKTDKTLAYYENHKVRNLIVPAKSKDGVPLEVTIAHPGKFSEQRTLLVRRIARQIASEFVYKDTVYAEIKLERKLEKKNIPINITTIKKPRKVYLCDERGCDFVN